VHSVSQMPNLRHLLELLGGTEGLLETVGLEHDKMFVMANKCKCRNGVSSILRGQQCVLLQKAKMEWTESSIDINNFSTLGLEVIFEMCYINLRFTYLLTYLLC